MAIPPIFKTDAIGVIGDSVTYGFGQARGWMFNFSRAIKNLYGPDPAQPVRPSGVTQSLGRPAATVSPLGTRPLTGYAAQRYPQFFMDASPGRKVGDISGTMATVLAPFIAGRTSVYFVELGTNDCGVTPAATFQTQVAAIRDSIVATPFFRILVWLTPWCNGGEQWPDGSNPVDLTTDGMRDKETSLLAAMAAVPGCYCISLRQLRLSTLNIYSNPGNVSTGVYTYDGTHPTSDPSRSDLVSGETLLTNYTISQLTFA